MLRRPFVVWRGEWCKKLLWKEREAKVGALHFRILLFFLQINAKRCIAIIDLKQKEIDDFELQQKELSDHLEECVGILDQMK